MAFVVFNKVTLEAIVSMPDRASADKVADQLGELFNNKPMFGVLDPPVISAGELRHLIERKNVAKLGVWINGE